MFCLNKIIKTINKWFDRVYELNYNDLSSNEAFSFGVLVKPHSFNESYSIVESDILRSVIESGEVKIFNKFCSKNTIYKKLEMLHETVFYEILTKMSTRTIQICHKNYSRQIDHVLAQLLY